MYKNEKDFKNQLCFCNNIHLQRIHFLIRICIQKFIIRILMQKFVIWIRMQNYEIFMHEIF